MNIKESAAAWLRSVVRGHVGANIRRYDYALYAGQLAHNALGYISYLSPQEGAVADVGEQFSLVKTSPNKFFVVLNALLSEPLQPGQKVRIVTYRPRRFDGSATDGTEDAAVNGLRSIVIGGAQSIFPVKWPGRHLGLDEKFSAAWQEIGNPYLREMIEQLEKLPANGGYRRLVNVLIDAGARNLVFVDPPEQDAATAPAIRMEVATAKFKGVLELRYDRAGDMYGISLQSGESTVDLADITFDELSEQLIDAIDDESWRAAKVTVLRAAKKRAVAA